MRFELITLIRHRFFLINAANIIALGAVWKRKQSGKGGSLPRAYDQSRELAAIDAATRVLDFCGQRNVFARKYSILVKGLREQLGRGLPTAVGDEASPSSEASRTTSQSSAPYNRPVERSSESPSNSDPMAENPAFQNRGISVEQSGTSTSPLTNAVMSRGHHASIGSLNADLEPWSEQFRISYPIDDISSYGTLVGYFAQCHMLTCERFHRPTARL
jgi:hypothetical protein